MDDEDLLRLQRKADFDSLVQQYRGKIECYCFTMLNHREDAENAAQETFIRAWKGLSKFRGDCPIKHWLYRIARNVCLDEIEKQKKGPVLGIDLDEVEAPSDHSTSAEPEYSVEDALSQLELAARKANWDELDCRMARLYFLFEFRFTEIARQIPMNESTVKSRFQRKIFPAMPEGQAGAGRARRKV